MISVTQASSVPWRALYALGLVLGSIDIFLLDGMSRHDIATTVEYVVLMPALVHTWLTVVVKEI